MALEDNDADAEADADDDDDDDDADDDADDDDDWYTRSSNDPITPDAWQGSHQFTNV